MKEEFKESPKILEFPNRLLISECSKERMYIIYLEELYISSSYALVSLSYNCVYLNSYKKSLKDLKNYHNRPLFPETLRLASTSFLLIFVGLQAYKVSGPLL